MDGNYFLDMSILSAENMIEATMKLEVICPACKKEFRFTDRSGLENVPCPHCGDQVPKDLGTIVADEAARPHSSPPPLVGGGQGGGPLPDDFRLSCPKCQSRLIVPTKLLGQSARCPGCKNVIPIPERFDA